jgi:hypothetical protein
MLDGVIKPIINAGKDLLNKIENLIKIISNENQGSNIGLVNIMKYLDMITEIVTHPLILGIFAIFIVIQIIEIILTAVTLGSFEIIKSSVIPFIKTIIISSVSYIVISTCKIDSNKGFIDNILDIIGISNPSGSGRESGASSEQEEELKNTENNINHIVFYLGIISVILSILVIYYSDIIGISIVSYTLALFSCIICACGDGALAELVALGIAVAGMLFALLSHADFMDKVAIKMAKKPSIPLSKILKSMKRECILDIVGLGLTVTAVAVAWYDGQNSGVWV